MEAKERANGIFRAGLVYEFAQRGRGCNREAVDRIILFVSVPCVLLRLFVLGAFAVLGTGSLPAAEKVVLPENVEIFTVKTRSEENKEVPF